MNDLYLPTTINQSLLIVDEKNFSQLNRFRGKVLSLVLRGEFPYKIGNVLQYKKEISITHGLFIEFILDKNCAVMILTPEDPIYTFVLMPRNVEVEARPAPAEYVRSWQDELRKMWKTQNILPGTDTNILRLEYDK